jgi:peptidyl-prolyl cis-trans isomerase B (cyclophilin B)
MDFGRKTAFALAALALGLCACSCEKEPPSQSKPDPAPVANPGTAPAAGGAAAGAPAGKNPVVVLETTQGTIRIELFPDKAPEHAKNFAELAKSGYYDGTYFHRVFPGFMIQGGDSNTKDDDPSNDGLGGHSYKGPGTLLRAEFNDVKHERGIVSMARGGMDVNSAGSQFFIMVAANRGLDRQYSAFGRVIEGMDVADKIVGQPGKPIPGAGGANPFERQYIKKARVEG